MIKAVIFDFDGVIADSFNAVFTATNRILEAFGKPSVTENEFREEFGADWKRFYRNRGATEDMIEKEPDLFRGEMDSLKGEIKVFDGINSVSHELMKKYKLGIVSNNQREFVIEFLQKFGIHGRFDSIVGYMPHAAKPDIEPLMICLDELGIKPEEACVIGDTRDEIAMARKANVAKVIVVSYGQDPFHKLEGADAVVHNPEEILDAIKKFGDM